MCTTYVKTQVFFLYTSYHQITWSDKSIINSSSYIPKKLTSNEPFWTIAGVYSNCRLIARFRSELVNKCRSHILCASISFCVTDELVRLAFSSSSSQTSIILGNLHSSQKQLVQCRDFRIHTTINFLVCIDQQPTLERAFFALKRLTSLSFSTYDFLTLIGIACLLRFTPGGHIIGGLIFQRYTATEEPIPIRSVIKVFVSQGQEESPDS